MRSWAETDFPVCVSLANSSGSAPIVTSSILILVFGIAQTFLLSAFKQRLVLIKDRPICLSDDFYFFFDWNFFWLGGVPYIHHRMHPCEFSSLIQKSEIFPILDFKDFMKPLPVIVVPPLKGPSGL